jgi:tetratricopeptide (TPR) repeat protein
LTPFLGQDNAALFLDFYSNNVYRYRGMDRFRNTSNYRSHARRQNALKAVMIFFAAAVAIGIPVFLFAGTRNRTSVERKELLSVWKSGDYNAAYSLSKAALETKPMDYFMLTTCGFSAFQLGISQINNQETLRYMDDCVFYLHKALLLKESENDGQVPYMLGKAYYYKGDDYADLAVKYLENAKHLSCGAADIPEFLGLAFSSLGDYRSSVEAFSQALSPERGEPSDLLLLSMARSYAALGEPGSARAYLPRCIDVSRDSKPSVIARLLLAEILGNAGNIQEAENQYLTVLENYGNNAEAHYQLGELYAKRGDVARARSEWRLSLRADPAHQKARERLR